MSTRAPDRATPARARESAARGSASDVAARIASGMPGIWRASTREVASGVTSRGAHPVPPVVKTRSHREVRSARAVSMASTSSAAVAEATSTTVNDPETAAYSRVAAITDGPLKSSYSPADARSEHVSTPNRTRAPFPGRRAHASSPPRAFANSASAGSQHTSLAVTDASIGVSPPPVNAPPPPLAVARSMSNSSCLACPSRFSSNARNCASVALFWCFFFHSPYGSPYTYSHASSYVIGYPTFCAPRSVHLAQQFRQKPARFIMSMFWTSARAPRCARSERNACASICVCNDVMARRASGRAARRRARCVDIA